MEDQRMSPSDIIDACYEGECDMGQIVDWETYEEEINKAMYPEEGPLLADLYMQAEIMAWDPDDDGPVYGNDDEEDY